MRRDSTGSRNLAEHADANATSVVLMQMSESLIPVYTINDHFQGVDAQNAEQTRAEMVSHLHFSAADAALCVFDSTNANFAWPYRCSSQADTLGGNLCIMHCAADGGSSDRCDHLTDHAMAHHNHAASVMTLDPLADVSLQS